MNSEAIIAWAQQKMLHTDEAPLERGYRYRHGKRVGMIAQRLVEQLGVSVHRELLFVGGLLHDVGKAGDRSTGHGSRGADLIAKEIPHLFTPDELDLVTKMVRNHCMRGNSPRQTEHERPLYPAEVLIIQDADTLDHFGTEGIRLAILWNAHHRRDAAGSVRYYNERDSKWRQEASEGMNYELSREILRKRIQRADEFFDAMAQAEEGKLEL
ncbi:MAG: HD domain-containing protein [Bacillota bacterium]